MWVMGRPGVWLASGWLRLTRDSWGCRMLCGELPCVLWRVQQDPWPPPLCMTVAHSSLVVTPSHITQTLPGVPPIAGAAQSHWSGIPLFHMDTWKHLGELPANSRPGPEALRGRRGSACMAPPSPPAALKRRPGSSTGSFISFGMPLPHPQLPSQCQAHVGCTKWCCGDVSPGSSVPASPAWLVPGAPQVKGLHVAPVFPWKPTVLCVFCSLPVVGTFRPPAFERA